MLILFDNGVPRGLAVFLIDRHTVTEARARGWAELENGELLRAAQNAGFEVLVTTDKRICHQQNLKDRTLALVVLGKGQWSLVHPHAVQIAATVGAATPGSYVEIEIPFKS